LLAFSSPSRLSRRFPTLALSPPPTPHPLTIRPPPTTAAPRTRPRARRFASCPLPSPRAAFQPLDEPSSAFLRSRSAHPRPYIVVVRCLPPLPAPSCRTSAFQPLTYLPPRRTNNPPRRQQRCRIAVRRRKRNLHRRTPSELSSQPAHGFSVVRSHTSFPLRREGERENGISEENDKERRFNFSACADGSSHTRSHVLKLCCGEFALCAVRG